MRRTKSGEKRSRDSRDQEAHNEDFKFISGLRLSQHPLEQKQHLFMKKFNNIVKAKSLHPKEFEGYTIRERFELMGWEQLLSFNCEKIYKRVVIQWTSSLKRNGDELTGIVDGKSYTITPAIIKHLLKVDTRKDFPYFRFNEADFQTTTDENSRRWNEACKTVFGLIENVKKGFGGYQRFNMTPLVQILWRIGVCTFHPRLEDMNCVLAREIYLLHALFTGDYLYSFAHLMIDDIWDMYEDKNRQNIPHGSYISEILKQLGAVSEHEYSETVPPQHRIISRSSFADLKFSESTTEYIIDDRVTEQRVTFPKKVIHEEVSPQFPRHWMPMPNPHVDVTQLLTNLQTISDKLSSESQKHHTELKLMVSNIQKQMECQALEAERREQEREKQAKEREKRAEEKKHEREKQAKEREKRAEEKEQEREKQAKEREIRAMEREKRAEEKEQEREKRAIEREKRAEEKEQEREIQAKERETRAEEKEQEREKRSEEKELEREKRAEEKEQEREKRAEEREQEREERAEEREQEGEKRAEEKELEREKRVEEKELEREKRVAEKEKCAEDREQYRVRQAEEREHEREKQAKERERRAEEMEKRAEERVKQAEGREHERERVAEEREKRMEEREKQAEIRAHAIIWDIERQRYFYEQDQEKLRMSWNQVNVVNGVDEFHFPQISHTSFHPPPEGSRYYDPTQGNEIPKAFQSLYHDIYGPKG